MKITLLIAFLAASGGLGWYLWKPKDGGGEKKAETRKVNVERGDLVLNVTATGEIKPVKEVEQRNLSLAESNLLSAEANLELTKYKYLADLKTSESGGAAAKEDEKQKA